MLTGDDAELARDHARKSGLPCDAVELVLENHPSQWAHLFDLMSLPRHWEEEEQEQSSAREAVRSAL